MTKIERYIPQDVYDAILAANAPSDTNPLATLADTLYNADGSTPGIRVVTLGGYLKFDHDVSGVDGYFQIDSGGYVKNATAIATDYFEYNHNTGVFLTNSNTHTITGFRANNEAGVNPTSLIEVFAGSTGNAYINIGSTTGRLDFYTNNTAIFSAAIDGSTGNWGFGGIPGANAIVDIISTTKAFKIREITAAQASALTAENGMIVNVSDTDGTFTSVGFWGRQGGTWAKM